MIISKELLSEVLGHNQIDNIELLYDDTILEFTYIDDNQEIGDDINIYELAHRCKEWALASHIRLWSVKDDNNSAICRINSREKEEFYAYTEAEAIFEACQWIYDKEQKSKRI